MKLLGYLMPFYVLLIPDPRKLFDLTKDDMMNISHDHDEDKYKRRSAFQWFQKWFK